MSPDERGFGDHPEHGSPVSGIRRLVAVYGGAHSTPGVHLINTVADGGYPWNRPGVRPEYRFSHPQNGPVLNDQLSPRSLTMRLKDPDDLQDACSFHIIS